MTRQAGDPRRRLTRTADFDAVYRRGRSGASRHLIVYAFRRDEGEQGVPPRVGVAVSRKVGGAVERNRLKRQLREAFARLRPEESDGFDVVLVARPSLPEAVEREGFEWLVEETRTLACRAREAVPA